MNIHLTLESSSEIPDYKENFVNSVLQAEFCTYENESEIWRKSPFIGLTLIWLWSSFLDLIA